jgi:hypothetical protein
MCVISREDSILLDSRPTAKQVLRLILIKLSCSRGEAGSHQPPPRTTQIAIKMFYASSVSAEPPPALRVF